MRSISIGGGRGASWLWRAVYRSEPMRPCIYLRTRASRLDPALGPAIRAPARRFAGEAGALSWDGTLRIRASRLPRARVSDRGPSRLYWRMRGMPRAREDAAIRAREA